MLYFLKNVAPYRTNKSPALARLLTHVNSITLKYLSLLFLKVLALWKETTGALFLCVSYGVVSCQLLLYKYFSCTLYKRIDHHVRLRLSELYSFCTKKEKYLQCWCSRVFHKYFIIFRAERDFIPETLESCNAKRVYKILSAFGSFVFAD